MFDSTKYWIAVLSLAAGVEVGATDERYIEFPKTQPEKVFRVKKVLDSQTGKIKLESNRPELSGVVDMLALEAAEKAASMLEHGNMLPDFTAKVQAMGLLEAKKVRFRIKSAEVTPLDKTQHGTEELRQNALQMLAAPPAAPAALVLARHMLLPLEGSDDRVFTVLADKTRLLAMKNDPDIASVWEDVAETRLSSPDLPTLAPSAYTTSLPSGSGSGVKVATFEDGLTSSFLSCLGISATYDGLVGDDDQKRHTQAAFRAMVSSAPSATFYHRRSSTFNGANDVNYIVNNSIQVVSMSLSRGGTSPHSATYSEFLTMDNMSFSHPFPLFINPSHNLGYDYAVNWQNYNALNVGNVRHTNNSNYEMAECTQTKNPPPRYGSCISGSGSGCAGDREMPHIVVPGIPYTGSTFGTTCIEGTGSISCGTSWSAPVANGIAASVIATDSRLVGWPEKTRAILVLTAQNVESGGWTVSGDERDGAGTISGADAVAFASSFTTVSPGNTACEKGVGAGSYYGSDFPSTRRYNLLVPNPKPSGKHLRVVLTWDSNPNVNNGTNDLSDLDLVVEKNGGYQTSYSWDSNYEVVDIAAADLTAGSSYYIDVGAYANRIPSGGFFYFAVVWGWVTDEAP